MRLKELENKNQIANNMASQLQEIYNDEEHNDFSLDEDFIK